jgi:hypothetical protein
VVVSASGDRRSATSRTPAPAQPALTPEQQDAAMKDLVEATKGQQWNVSRGKSKKDDSTTVTISTSASNLGRDVLGRDVVPKLYVRCMENSTDLIVSVDGSYLSNESIPVTTRIDKARAETVEWGVSTGHDAVLRRQPIPFIRKLVDSETLWVQVTPHGQDPMSFTFVTYGLDKHIGEVQKACRWN